MKHSELMNLVRFKTDDGVKPGIITGDGQLLDCSHLVQSWDRQTLPKNHLQSVIDSLATQVPNAVPFDPQSLDLPFTGTRSFICVGLNYYEHAAEVGRAVPTEPLLFMKSVGAICGPNDEIAIPQGAKSLDWETELAVVISDQCLNVPLDEVDDVVAGITMVNDISEREWQRDRGGSWDKGKSYRNFGPVGPYLRRVEKLSDLTNLKIETKVNNKVRQTGQTDDMIFDLRFLIHYVSTFFPLEPGDIIATGTPAGVGAGVKPTPEYLRPNDVLSCSITSLGSQRHKIVIE